MRNAIELFADRVECQLLNFFLFHALEVVYCGAFEGWNQRSCLLVDSAPAWKKQHFTGDTFPHFAFCQERHYLVVEASDALLDDFKFATHNQCNMAHWGTFVQENVASLLSGAPLPRVLECHDRVLGKARHEGNLLVEIDHLFSLSLIKFLYVVLIRLIVNDRKVARTGCVNRGMALLRACFKSKLTKVSTFAVLIQDTKATHPLESVSLNFELLPLIKQYFLFLDQLDKDVWNFRM